MVLEEELDVDGLGVWLVAEERYEVLEALGQVVGAVVFERVVHLFDEVLSDKRHAGATVFDEGSGVGTVPALALKLLFLLDDLVFQGINVLSFSCSFLLQGTEFLIEGRLLLLKAVDLDVDGILHSGGVVTVGCLELGHIEESLLALVTLLSDEVEQLFLAHAVKHIPNLLICTRDKKYMEVRIRSPDVATNSNKIYQASPTIKEIFHRPSNFLLFCP